jgi:hypothetical protein
VLSYVFPCEMPRPCAVLTRPPRTACRYAYQVASEGLASKARHRFSPEGGRTPTGDGRKRGWGHVPLIRRRRSLARGSGAG